MSVIAITEFRPTQVFRDTVTGEEMIKVADCRHDCGEPIYMPARLTDTDIERALEFDQDHEQVCSRRNVVRLRRA